MVLLGPVAGLLLPWGHRCSQRTHGPRLCPWVRPTDLKSPTPLLILEPTSFQRVTPPSPAFQQLAVKMSSPVWAATRALLRIKDGEEETAQTLLNRERGEHHRAKAEADRMSSDPNTLKRRAKKDAHIYRDGLRKLRRYAESNRLTSKS